MLAAKHDLSFTSSYLNRAGFLGFTPDPRSPINYAALGAFITNPVSIKPRSAAAPPRIISFLGGFLLHTGHPNPGLRSVIDRYRRRWEISPIPILVHLLAEDPDSVRKAIEILEQIDGVTGVEIGLPPETDSQDIVEFLQAAQGELPFLLQIPESEAGHLITTALDSGAAGLTIGPPRGVLPGPSGSLVSGRLYGPAALPLVLNSMRKISRPNVPIIAGGGVSTEYDAIALKEAGASAVFLDFVLWNSGASDLLKPNPTSQKQSSLGHH